MLLMSLLHSGKGKMAQRRRRSIPPPPPQHFPYSLNLLASVPLPITLNFSAKSAVPRRAVVAVIFLLALVLSCALLYKAADNIGIRGLHTTHVFRFLQDSSVPSVTPGSIIDLFLESFRIGDKTSQLLNHLVIIALDQKAFSRCLAVHSHCFALIDEEVDFSSEAYFMTPDYLRMMWTRINFLRSVLELGYNFVFTDADVLWFRDPFPEFDPDVDFQIACDHFTGIHEDIENRPNGGFKFVRSNNRSIEFYKFWYSSRKRYPGLHDQDVLNRIKNDSFTINSGIKMRFLDTALFGGFCEPGQDLNEVCTMHANCCFGLDSKLHDLRILLEDWKNYLSLPPTSKLYVPSWRVPQNCRLDVDKPHMEADILDD
ncbi:uncharacterized protein At4g15970 isoform X2 [Andrographis paniculata]|uniref:uncharacterized protein At4g15970 isoform X2 n=1 Tax=Andrographis paniculata TaxID=175694 RepID=UPI0021E82ED5|nr:uncharacterized protein At4g15970 isoform X2 [Andrographis paniculata]